MDNDEAEILRLKNLRLGPDACCKNCRHAYPMRMSPNDLTTLTVCTQAPPIFQFVPAGQDRAGNTVMRTQQIHRTVESNFFCGSFSPAPDVVN